MYRKLSTHHDFLAILPLSAGHLSEPVSLWSTWICRGVRRLLITPWRNCLLGWVTPRLPPVLTNARTDEPSSSKVPQYPSRSWKRGTYILWGGSGKPSFSSRGLAVWALPVPPRKCGSWTPQTLLILKMLQSGVVVVGYLFLKQKAL